MNIYVTTYEVIGGHEVAEAHFAAIDAAQQEHWAFATEMGGCGFRPNSDGGVRSVFFDELPSGWRKVGTDRGKIEACPRRSTQTGKLAEQAMRALLRCPDAGSLARSFGYSPSELAIDGSRGVIYFPTVMRTEHPVQRTFLRLPRFAKDGFEPDPAMLRALPESEFMAALEAHNAEARRLRAEGGAA